MAHWLPLSRVHHFLSFSIFGPLSLIDDVTMPPFVGYILSRYFRDSFRKFCGNYKFKFSWGFLQLQLFPPLTLIAVSAATMAGEPKPCEMREKCVRCL